MRFLRLDDPGSILHPLQLAQARPAKKGKKRSSRSCVSRILRSVEPRVCAHWHVITAEAEQQRRPLASQWSPCLGSPQIDQEALARAWGLLEAINRPPY